MPTCSQFLSLKRLKFSAPPMGVWHHRTSLSAQNFPPSLRLALPLLWLSSCLLLYPFPSQGKTLKGYIKRAIGNHLILNLGAKEGLKRGTQIIILQYDQEIAQAQVIEVGPEEAMAQILLQKPGTLVRTLDTFQVLEEHRSAPPPENLSANKNPHQKKPSEKEASSTDQQEHKDTSPLPPSSNQGWEAIQPTLPPPSLLSKFIVSKKVLTDTLLPREHFIYSALSSLASEGLLPGVSGRVFRGDWLITEKEAYELLHQALIERKKRPPYDPRFRQVDTLLASLSQILGVQSPLEAKERFFTLIPFSRIRLATGGQNRLDSLGQLDILVRLGKKTSGVLSLSRIHRDWHNNGNAFPLLDKVYWVTHQGGWDWTLGKNYLRWGPGYAGSLILGDESTGLWMLKMNRDWSLGRFFGRWRVEQFFSTFTENHQRRYFVGRRLERPLNPYFSLGFSETAKMDKAPNPLIGLLPYLIYQKLFEDDTNRMNIQIGSDFYFRSGLLDFYSEVFIDDLTAPPGFRGQGKVPRKIGWLGGIRYPHLLGLEGLDLRMEYGTTDPHTYLHRNPAVSYFQRSRPLGHPMGPNARSFFLRASQRPSPKSEVALSFWKVWPRTKTDPEIQSINQITLFGAYDLSPRTSIGLRITPTSVTSPLKGKDRFTLLEIITDHSF